MNEDFDKISLFCGTAVLLLLVVSLSFYFFPKKQEQPLSGTSKPILESFVKPKNINLKEVVLGEGIIENNKQILVKIDLYNQLKSQKAISEMNCFGKELVNCISSQVDTVLKDYKVNTVPVKDGQSIKNYDVNLETIK